jgi:3-deoxy-D-manno-octulosonate 8-phosphate phosphatase KdsC-like HAD superfamily phosphatase
VFGSDDGVFGSDDGVFGSDDGVFGSDDGVFGSDDGVFGSDDGGFGSDDGMFGSGDDRGRRPIPSRHGPARPGHLSPREGPPDGPLAPNPAAAGPELWFSRPGQPPVRFTFAERPRFDAVETITRLRRMGLKARLLSGDREASVARIAAAVGIDDWRARCSPIEKVAALREMGSRVLMVGDGLNDGPCLAEAHVSASPATAADISQTLADAVFQGAGLGAIADLIVTARRARGLMRGNIGLSLLYNSLMVPLAISGMVTPWLAAAAMSASSLLVIGNSFRARA